MGRQAQGPVQSNNITYPSDMQVPIRRAVGAVCRVYPKMEVARVTVNTTLAKALEYTARGWMVLPLAPMQKIPALPGGYKSATLDPDTIREWFDGSKDYNIGVAAGQCSGIVFLDFDTYKSPQATPQKLIEQLTQNRADEKHKAELEEAFQNAPCFRTARSGLQLIFKAPDAPLKCTSNIGDYQGIDLRADGGYSALPPSRTRDGAYEWIREGEPPMMPAVLERWILQSLRSCANAGCSTDVAVGAFSNDVTSWLRAKAPQLLLGRKRSVGTGLMVHCPAHDDRNPSLHVELAGDRVLLHCFAGCSIERVLSALGLEMRDLFLSEAKLPPSGARIDRMQKRRKFVTNPPASSQSRVEFVCDSVAGQKDYGHARELAHLFCGQFRWAHKMGGWMRYIDSEGRWKDVPEEVVIKAASEALRRHYGERFAESHGEETKLLETKLKETTELARMKNALNFLKGWDGIITYPHEWDADPWLLNVKNGTLNLKDFELGCHSPNHLITKLAPVAYDPDADPGPWLEHIFTLLPDPDVRRQLQRDLGSALPGAVLQECLPIWYGTGCNGKSTTANIIMRVLGDYVCRAAPKLLVQEQFGRHPTEIADLLGRRLVFSIETERTDRLAEAVVKDLTGGDRKKARFLYRDFFEFEQTFTLVLLTNHKPTITGTDSAIWRRIRLVPWTIEVPVEKRREQTLVVDELVEECGSAILTWLLDGLADFRSDKTFISSAVRAATDEYQEEMDLLKPFIVDRCDMSPRAEVSKKDLYDAYLAWCGANGEKPLSQSSFGRRLKERGIKILRRGHENARIYIGIRLKRSV
ncbi:MAG: phage/plasmid primase, P4 family [Armatimonadota bacterium]